MTRQRNDFGWYVFLATMGLSVWFAIERAVPGQEPVALPRGYAYVPGRFDETCDRRGPLRTIIGNIRDRREDRQGAGQVAPATAMPGQVQQGPIQPVYPQIRPATPPAATPSAASSAGGSTYANPQRAEVESLQAQLADARKQLREAQGALADCAEAQAEWRARADHLAMTAANEHQAREELAAALAEAQANCESCGTGDPWWWRWAPTIAGGTAALIGVTMPWWAPAGWLGYRVVSRRRRRRAGAGEAPADDPFP